MSGLQAFGGLGLAVEGPVGGGLLGGIGAGLGLARAAQIDDFGHGGTSTDQKNAPPCRHSHGKPANFLALRAKLT